MYIEGPLKSGKSKFLVEKFVELIQSGALTSEILVITQNSYKKKIFSEKIREKLIELPGVGPYTADLTIGIGFRLPTFHLDLFSREALYQFYFKGKVLPDEKLRNFADKKWGKWKHLVMLLLTTNTDDWAKKAGFRFRLKSGAKNY